ncbi:MAG: DUF1289 domain-containing protein [Pseudomonadota bacterium]
MNAAAMPAASPCIGVCRLHEAARVCIGCGRTGDEIAGWGSADHANRQAVVAALPARLSAIEHTPVATVASPMTVRSTLERALAQPDTAVVVGCHGAVAEFMTPPGERPHVEVDGASITAVVKGGAARLTFGDGLALFATAAPAGATKAPRLLAAPAAHRKLPIAQGLTRLGNDPAPIARAMEPDSLSTAQDRDLVLYDLGLGFRETRFMIRSADTTLIARLDALEGAKLGTLLAEAGTMLLEASPDRVAESPFCRVEVTTKIPPPGARSPRAPHTHLMPGAIALGRLLPPGVGCPPEFVPVALIYGGEGAK